MSSDVYSMSLRAKFIVSTGCRSQNRTSRASISGGIWTNSQAEERHIAVGRFSAVSIDRERLFLETIDVIVNIDEVRIRQELPLDKSTEYIKYVITGHNRDWILRVRTKQRLWQNFSKLTLMSWNPDGKVEEFLTSTSPELGEIEFCTDPKVDVFLKTYKQKKYMCSSDM